MTNFAHPDFFPLDIDIIPKEYVNYMGHKFLYDKPLIIQFEKWAKKQPFPECELCYLSLAQQIASHDKPEELRQLFYDTFVFGCQYCENGFFRHPKYGWQIVRETYND